MDLPQAIRYRPYKEWSSKDYQAITEKMAQSPWHSQFHVEPKTGLLNDPNGFLISTVATIFFIKTGLMGLRMV